ncbi:MAG: hypothetical protein F6K14_29790 [Symploca sp. SIO2C1]|nr:hypothetical protein [Symploca sp. SIO2C1]
MNPLTQAEKEAIQYTAYITIAALAKNTSIPYCREIIQNIIAENKADLVEINSSSSLHYLVELRYKTSEKIIREGEYQQVIELGAGLTPHALNLQQTVTNYIEVDLAENSHLKRRIVQKLEPSLTVHYVAGDIFASSTWSKLKGLVKPGVPVAIFAEGFLIYSSQEQRQFLGEQIREILADNGGMFFMEDSLRFHPEVQEIPKIKNFTIALSNRSKNTNYSKSITQEDLTKEWHDMGLIVKRREPDKKLETAYSREDEEVLDTLKHWLLFARSTC